MFYRAHHRLSGYLMIGPALLALVVVGGAASAQTQLPEVVVSAPKQKPKPQRAPAHVAPAPAVPVTPAAQLNAKADAFDVGRSNLYTTIGTTSDTISHATIDALPQGT
ncbi:MAG: hypothetical protein ABSE67_22520, partial [Xanthobacteraceae bacterium]